MQINFPSHDDKREVERILGSMSILVDLAKENVENVLFLTVVFERMHRVVDVTDNALNDILAQFMLDLHNGDPLTALVEAEPYITYQTQVDEMIKDLLRVEDQNAQVERRNGQKD